MPITRSRAQPTAEVAVSKPAKKNKKTTKTTEKSPAVESDGVSSEDDIPLASVKAKATGKTKAPNVTKPASKKPTKAVSKVPPKQPMELTFCIPQDESNIPIDEEPVVNARITKKKAEPKSPVNEDDEMEEIDEAELEAKVTPQKRKPVVAQIKVTLKQKFPELDVDESSPDVTSSKQNKEPVSRNEIRNILSETMIIEPNPKLLKNGVKKAQKSKPVGSKKAKPTTSSDQESEDEENDTQDSENPDQLEDQLSSAEQLPEPDAKVSRKGQQKKKIPVIVESESEEYETDLEYEENECEQSESDSNAIKKGAKKEELSADKEDSLNVPQKKGAVKKSKKLPRKASTKKGVSKTVEGLSKMMQSLDLQSEKKLSDIMDDLNVGSKKGKKKTIATKTKPKASGTKTKRAKEVDSEPESSTLKKFSSTESLKNVTVRGVSRSQSEDNLNSITPALLHKPPGRRAPRVIAKKPVNVESEEEEIAVTKKTKAPRRKAAK